MKKIYGKIDVTKPMDWSLLPLITTTESHWTPIRTLLLSLQMNALSQPAVWLLWVSSLGKAISSKNSTASMWHLWTIRNPKRKVFHAVSGRSCDTSESDENFHLVCLRCLLIYRLVVLHDSDVTACHCIYLDGILSMSLSCIYLIRNFKRICSNPTWIHLFSLF